MLRPMFNVRILIPFYEVLSQGRQKYHNVEHCFNYKEQYLITMQCFFPIFFISKIQRNLKQKKKKQWNSHLEVVFHPQKLSQFICRKIAKFHQNEWYYNCKFNISVSNKNFDFDFQYSMPKIEYFRILKKKSLISLTKFCSLKKKVF